MKAVALKFPDPKDLAPNADLHDVLAYVEEATEALRQAGFEPSWYHDVADEPPAIGCQPILDRVLAGGDWPLRAHEARVEHEESCGPELFPV